MDGFIIHRADFSSMLKTAKPWAALHGVLVQIASLCNLKRIYSYIMQCRCIFSCSLPGLLGRPPKTQTSAAGQCAGRRFVVVGEVRRQRQAFPLGDRLSPAGGSPSKGEPRNVTVRPLAPPLGELLSGCEAERASTPTSTQKGSGSRSQEPLPAVLWGM